MISTRPYLVRAFYQWIIDNNFTPYIVVNTEMPYVQVPTQFIENGKIVLNVSPFAIDKLEIGNHYINFDASFSGTVEHISTPVKSVLAIYAKENGKGMVFNDDDDDGDDSDVPPPPSKPVETKKKDKNTTNKPNLRIVK